MFNNYGPKKFNIIKTCIYLSYQEIPSSMGDMVWWWTKLSAKECILGVKSQNLHRFMQKMQNVFCKERYS